MKARFNLAEHMRFDSNSKPIVLGLIPDFRILLPGLPPEIQKQSESASKEAPPRLIRQGLDLAILVTFTEAAPGDYSFEAYVTSPNGSKSEPQKGSFVTSEDRSANVLFEFKPFVVEGYGEYLFSIQSGNFTATQPFSIELPAQK